MLFRSAVHDTGKIVFHRLLLLSPAGTGVENTADVYKRQGLFAAAPLLFPRRPFAGFCAGMFLFAAAGGLQELLLSPILDALPIPEAVSYTHLMFFAVRHKTRPLFRFLRYPGRTILS